MKTVHYAVCCLLLLFWGCHKQSETKPSATDGAFFNGNVNGVALSYPGLNNKSAYGYCNSFDSDDSLIMESGVVLPFHTGNLGFFVTGVSFPHSVKGVDDYTFLKAIKPGYYRLGYSPIGVQTVMIGYIDENDSAWNMSADQKGSSFYIASSSLSTFQGHTAVKANVIFRCLLIGPQLSGNKRSIPLSGSAQIYFLKPNL